MKTVTVRDLQKQVKGCVDDAQDDRVVITRRGKPAAVLIGVEGEDWGGCALADRPPVLEADPRKEEAVHNLDRRAEDAVTKNEMIGSGATRGCGNRTT